ncbi:MAG: DUF817 domain-containing protein [Gemmatimonadota bacterium]|nr:DUF817 domain-containing protein [Gemmatimonadota bacterium]
MPIRLLDAHLLNAPARPQLSGIRRAAVEAGYFIVKEARACLFVALFFAAVFAVPRAGVLGVPRYDLLLLIALAIQGWMLWTGLETWDELAVGSYIIQAWRVFDLRVRHHPPYWMATLIAVAIYANFFTHHYVGDFRWYLAACALGLYARTSVVFRPYDRDRTMPLLLAFLLIGFFIWLAENISTFFGVWRYPDQLGAWTAVHVGKWSSWSLLVIMTFTIVANLKHIKERVHVAAT